MHCDGVQTDASDELTEAGAVLAAVAVDTTRAAEEDADAFAEEESARTLMNSCAMEV